MEFRLLGKYGDRVAMVDECDADLAAVGWTGRSDQDGRTVYLQKTGGRLKTRILHREVMERVLGRPLTKSELVDHKSGDGLDNRRQNLRLATHRQNMCNRRSTTGSSSRYLGVHYDTPRGNWRARARGLDGKYVDLGRFESEEEAAVAYNQGATRLHGEFARLNVIGNETAPLDAGAHM